MVAVLVGEDVGVHQRAALGAELGLQLVVEAQVDVHEVVAGAVERAGAGVGGAAAGVHRAREERGVDPLVARRGSADLRRDLRIPPARPVRLDRVDVSHDGAVELRVRVRSGTALAREVGGARPSRPARVAEPSRHRRRRPAPAAEVLHGEEPDDRHDDHDPARLAAAPAEQEAEEQRQQPTTESAAATTAEAHRAPAARTPVIGHLRGVELGVVVVAHRLSLA